MRTDELVKVSEDCESRRELDPQPPDWRDSAFKPRLLAVLRSRMVN